MAFRLRSILAGLTLVSHLMLTVGFPLPAPGQAAGPFPCQGHACGCLTAELCWAGDCCCFTLEEKLAWAEANGVEPPEHARQRVQVRDVSPEPEEGACDPATSACCCRERQDSEVTVRWVVGLFAGKCRGQDAPGTLRIDPGLPPDLNPQPHAVLEPDEKGPAFDTPVPSTSHSPPTPPPRRS